jgi:hypothetical protein
MSGVRGRAVVDITEITPPRNESGFQRPALDQLVGFS